MAKDNKTSRKNSPQFNVSGFGSDANVNEQDGMDNVADSAVNEAQNQLQNAKASAQEIKNAPEKIKNTATKVKNAPKKIKNTSNKIKQNVKNIPKRAKKIANGTMKVVKGVGKFIRHPIKSIKNGVLKVPEKLLKLGQNLKNTLNPKKWLDKLNPLNKIKRKINEIKKRVQRIKDIPKRIRKLVKTIQKIIKLAIKAIKMAIKATVKIVQLAIKLIQILIQIIIATWPIWLIALILGVILGILWWILDNDSTSDNKSYDGESAQYNETTTDADGNAKVKSVSGNTKIVEAFYQYFAEKSLWVVYEGTIYNDESIEHDDVYGDVYSPLQYNSQSFDEKFKDPDTGEVILKDYQNRESMFYINPNALFVFDKYLHGQQIRFPEQIVQHVAYDYNPSALKGSDINETNDESCLTDYDSPDNRFVLKQLTDDDTRVLNITSQKYKQISTSDSSVSDTFKTANPSVSTIYVPDGNNKELGVWDYGLGSILHYVKYLIKHENRGSYSDFEVWDNTIVMDPETGLQSSGVVKKFNSYSEYEDDENKENYTATDIADLTGDDRLKTYTEDDCPDSMKSILAHEDSYFIDWVVTPVGDITNTIVYDWKDSNEPFTQPESFESEETKKSEKIVIDNTNTTQITRTISATSSDSSCAETVNYNYKKVLPRPIRDSVNGEIKTAEFNDETKSYSWTCNATSTTTYTCSVCGTVTSSHSTTTCGGTVSSTTTYDHSSCPTTADVYMEEEKVEEDETTVTQTFTSHIKGTRWDKKPYYDGEPNMDNLTGKRYYEDYLTHYDTYVPSEVSGFFDYNSLMKRINATDDDDLKKILERSSMDSNSNNSLSGSTDGGTASDSVQSFIQKAAPIAVEDGQHTGIYPSITIAQAILEGGAGTSNLAKNYYNHFGMSAHEIGKTITFWDGSTYVGESMTSSSGRNWQSWASASDADAGLRFSILDHSRNFWKSSLPYIGAGVTSHISAGLSPEEAKEDATRQLAELQPIYAPDSDGNAGYQEKIIQIIETYNLWQYDEEMIANGGWDGTNPYPELGGSGSGSGSSSSGGITGAISSIWSWLKGVMTTVREKYADLFGRDTYYNILEENERFKWNYHAVQESDVDYVIQSIFAYTDGKVISEYYGKVDDEFFKQYYTTLFSNPIGTKWSSSSVQDSSSNTFYGEQQAMYYPDGFQRPLDECKLSSETSNYGVYLQATDGENVFAACDGTISEVGEDDRYGGKYVILDNGSSKTIYGHLKDINVSKGDSVHKGDVIATVDGDKLFFGITNENNVVVDPTFVITYAVNDGTLGGQIATYGTQFVGEKYVYGGSWNGENPYSPTDCSGFVHGVYAHFGISTPRKSSAFATAGIAISESDLIPGDVICYSSNGTVGGVHHVAIYIGNGKIVHASNSKPYPKGGIKISNMSYSSDKRICRRLTSS